MRFSTASRIVDVVQQMKLFDLPRSSNRAKIDNLFNGFPPYTEAEARDNRIDVNVNFLEAPQLAHDARRQFSNAFLSPSNFFNVSIDRGPIHRRDAWARIITSEINKRMKRSRYYRETLRNIFGQLVLHGVGPSVWNDRERWIPDMMMMGDVMMPSGTLLTMENVPYFAIYRRYTAEKLWRMTHGAKVDKAWNVPLADRCIAWAHRQWGQTRSSNDYIYSPEKMAEDLKADLGVFSTDQVPTIDCWDFYFLEDEGKEFGWHRRIVLDTPSGETASDGFDADLAKDSKREFLYDSGKRRYAREMDSLIHFQFADGSQVAPFRYHSVRSLGWLLYSVCHLQNRLRCRLNSHAFENLLQYLRFANPDDAERAIKIDLIDRGILPDGVGFVPQNERWQINEKIIQTVMSLNRRSMADNSASWTQDPDYASGDQEKTATQVTAEVNATTALVGSMLQEAYGYQEFQYREIAHRFCVPNSRDADVRAFRVECLKQGVPVEILNADCWNLRAERVLGSGNKQLEIAQSSMLMQNITLYEPDAQRSILRTFTFAVTGDAKLTEELVPMSKQGASDSVHDAQLAAATLFTGMPMVIKMGVNHQEYAGALLGAMQSQIQKIEAKGGMATIDELAGLQNIAGQMVNGQPIPGNGATVHIQILAQNPQNKQIVKMLGDELGKMMNMVKAYGQRLAEQQQQEGGQQQDPELQAKVQAEIIKAQTKSQINMAQAQQKMQQRQMQFDQKAALDQEKHQLEMANRLRSTEVEEAAIDLKTAGEIRRSAKEETNPLDPNGAMK